MKTLKLDKWEKYIIHELVRSYCVRTEDEGDMKNNRKARTLLNKL